MDEKVKAALTALSPFAEVYALYERNHYLDGLDLIVRQNGHILGHAGILVEDLKKAHETFVALGGEMEA